MSQIAVIVKDGIISDYADENSAQAQMRLNVGWILVDSDPAFSVEEKNLWTVRSEDNALVHKSTNQTSAEEKNSVLTKLTLKNLSLKSDMADMNKIQTAQTLQNLQDEKDKEDQQKVITNLTMQLMKLSNNSISGSTN
ncbi:hypothetical protein [Companilactobacillus kimchiensis]|uniref:Uncharacterized protein n=1 Tax=Companilactobacillus kimchiensis TaxID=993692 RepID=A0A0R2LH42_9LACO|nr:hypothetical protein [Companilactobacillus kimchiensis]KRO00881.1 hypothetical protein IV57_GL000203 [Companilactobacillus kimchiensis]